MVRPASGKSHEVPICGFSSSTVVSTRYATDGLLPSVSTLVHFCLLNLWISLSDRCLAVSKTTFRVLQVTMAISVYVCISEQDFSARCSRLHNQSISINVHDCPLARFKVRYPCMWSHGFRIIGLCAEIWSCRSKLPHGPVAATPLSQHCR